MLLQLSAHTRTHTCARAHTHTYTHTPTHRHSARREAAVQHTATCVCALGLGGRSSGGDVHVPHRGQQAREGWGSRPCIEEEISDEHRAEIGADHGWVVRLLAYCIHLQIRAHKESSTPCKEADAQHKTDKTGNVHKAGVTAPRPTWMQNVKICGAPMLLGARSGCTRRICVN
eukprot:1159045-Pelagomonas_calceolata.AAC.11